MILSQNMQTSVASSLNFRMLITVE